MSEVIGGIGSMLCRQLWSHCPQGNCFMQIKQAQWWCVVCPALKSEYPHASVGINSDCTQSKGFCLLTPVSPVPLWPQAGTESPLRWFGGRYACQWMSRLMPTHRVAGRSSMTSVKVSLRLHYNRQFFLPIVSCIERKLNHNVYHLKSTAYTTVEVQ